jgi:hypothetical protein
MKKKKFNFTIMYIGQKMDFDRNRTTETEIDALTIIPWVLLVDW